MKGFHCTKVKFDKKTAQTKKNYFERIGKARSLRIYHCPECKAWHLTKQRAYRKKTKHVFRVY